MKVFNYKDHIEELSSRTGTDKSEVFFYDGTPLESICEDLFQFFQNSFDIDFSHFGILPGYIFFGSDRSPNGWATRHPNGSIICIHIGAVLILADKFLLEDKLVEKSSNSNGLKHVELLLNNSLNNLMLQSAYLFFFYHELGHLIQRSSSIFNKMMEVTSSKNAYSKEQHIREADADMFAGIQLARQILNKYDKFTEQDKNIDVLTDFASFVAAGAGLFMLMFNSFSEAMYTKQNSHPHSMVRLMIILDTVINYTLLKFGIPSEEMVVREKLVRKSILLLDELLPTLYGDQYRSNLMAQYTNSQKDIFAYSKELIEEVKTYHTGAIYKWNQIAKSWKV